MPRAEAAPRGPGALLISTGAYVRVGGPLVAELWWVSRQDGRVTRRVRLSPSIAPDRVDHAGVPGWVDDVLWQPTCSTVLAIDPADGRVRAEVSHSILSDVHSVSAGRDGGLLLTSTGNEAVVELSRDGALREVWPLGPALDPAREYRRLHHRAFKPHRVHPNHAIWHGDRLLVTGLDSQRCVDLRDRRFAIPIPEGPPHDGRLREGLLWFTTTQGWILGVCPDTGARRVAIDLGAMARGEGLSGWCRGVEVVGDRLWVGLSQVRRAPWREVGRRVLRGDAGRKRPARVVEIDWRRGRLIREIALEEEGGVEIYGITALGGLTGEPGVGRRRDETPGAGGPPPRR